jgi:Bacterial PH domain/Domain of unknown function (DUF1648)
MEWQIERRLGNGVGTGIIAWLIILDLLMIWVAAQLPISAITFVLAMLSLATLPMIALIAYWLIGLNRSAYWLDRNMLTIRWGAVQQVIPMASIRQVLHGSEIGGQVRRFRGGHWPGHWVGQAEVSGLGPALFYAAGGLDQQLIVVTPGVAYAITPADIAGFVEAFEQRQKMGPTQEVTQASIRPEIFDWSLWSDRLALGLLGMAVVACLLLFGYTSLRFPDLAPRVALHFDALGNPDRFGPRLQVFFLPIIGLMSLGADVVIGLPIYLRDRVGAYLLWSGAFVVQILAWVAAVGIVS